MFISTGSGCIVGYGDAEAKKLTSGSSWPVIRSLLALSRFRCQVGPGEANVMCDWNSAFSERQCLDFDHAAGFDHERTQITLQRDDRRVLIAMPPVFPQFGGIS